MSYALSSVYMTIAQKFVVVHAPRVKALFLFYQNLAALILYIPSKLGLLRRFKIEPYPLWETEVALQVAPLGVTYSVMLYSSNYALSLLSVPMISVLKNIGPILITVVESLTDGLPVSGGLVVSMVMLILGSVVAAFNDLQFDTMGYAAMAINVGANLVHVNFMKRVQKTKIPKAVVLHYQSVFFVLLLLPQLWAEDLPAILSSLAQQPLTVLIAFISTGINGVIIALCTMWAIEATSGSTYSMVSALNPNP